MPKPLPFRAPGPVDLHAGVLQPTDGGDPRVVAPPDRPLYDQLSSALLEQAGEPPSTDPLPQAEAHAAVAVCIRWGSYLGVLANPDKPQWQGWAPDASRITDEEMARLNIEISANVAEFLTLKFEHPQRYATLVHRANELPLAADADLEPSRAPGLFFLAMQAVDASDRFDDQQPGELPETAKKQIHEAPIRVIANTATLHAWRNAPVENIHSGVCRPTLPVLQRRITEGELAKILTFALEAMEPFFEILPSSPSEDHEDHARELAARCQGSFLHSPEGWSLTESCRPIELEGEEPSPPG